MLEDVAEIQFWMVLAGFLIAFVLAFGIGANDVANSFGTSVGSKVLTLKQACILATIFEILGSILIGGKVSGTIRKGIVDPEEFTGAETELMFGYLSALIGCCVWLILATILNYPVSGTHSIVGATVGMAIVSKGITVIKWREIIKIVLSWFISPLLSGLVSLIMFVVIRKFILRAENPLKAGLRFLPIIYTITITVNVGGIVQSSPSLLGVGNIPFWGHIIVVAVIATVVYLAVWLIMVPFMNEKIKRTLASLSHSNDDLELNDKYNNLELNNNGELVMLVEDEKKNMATQVDYITLIMARQEDPKLLEKADLENEMKRKHSATSGAAILVPPNIDEINRLGDSFATVHGNSNIDNSKKHVRSRIRTITAPTSHLKDVFDIGDVNLTLRGYLHSIHTPVIRQQMSNKTLNQKSMQAKDRQSITNTIAGTTSLGNGNNDGVLVEPPSFTKLFYTQKSAPVDVNKPSTDNNMDAVSAQTQPEGTGNDHFRAAQATSNETKRGRFNLVPAKMTKDSGLLDASLSASDKSSLHKTGGSILDIDAEVEENILELPTKKDKKDQHVDAYAHSDPPAAAKLFSFLQVLTAVFGSFAHGGNDVSNAIGPLIGLYLIYQEGKVVGKASSPEWILFYGGVGISVGLWILGRRVIKTIGEDLTKITASSGFVIELASAMTVLGASLINIPVSTTHCKVGSVVFTGRIRSKESVDWSLFRNIIIAWIVTVPVTGSIAAFCQYMFKLMFIK